MLCIGIKNKQPIVDLPTEVSYTPEELARIIIGLENGDYLNLMMELIYDELGEHNLFNIIDIKNNLNKEYNLRLLEQAKQPVITGENGHGQFSGKIN